MYLCAWRRSMLHLQVTDIQTVTTGNKKVLQIRSSRSQKAGKICSRYRACCLQSVIVLRDILAMSHQHEVLQTKAFAAGVRMEHPQEMINKRSIWRVLSAKIRSKLTANQKTEEVKDTLYVSICINALNLPACCCRNKYT